MLVGPVTNLLYQAMAEANIETLTPSGANERRIVTSPHRSTTIGKEYGELGGHYTVFIIPSSSPILLVGESCG